MSIGQSTGHFKWTLHAHITPLRAPQKYRRRGPRGKRAAEGGRRRRRRPEEGGQGGAARSPGALRRNKSYVRVPLGALSLYIYTHIHMICINTYTYTNIYIYIYISAGPSKRMPPGCEAAVQSNSSTTTFLSLKFNSYRPES